MKKMISLLASIMMLLGMTQVVLADDDSVISYQANSIRVQNNGEYIDFTDREGNVVEPQIINGRTMVPFRKIFNALGVTDENIAWNGETRTVTAKKDAVQIELHINNTSAQKTVSGETMEIQLDAAPVIVDGRTLVPVRFIAESMNKKVGWDNFYRTVIIIDTDELVNDLEKSLPNFMGMMNESTEMPETYSSKTTLTGKIEYKDKDNKSNNAAINLNGSVDVAKLTDAITIDLLLKLTGKGDIYDALKEIKMTTIDANMIAQDNSIYLKSSLLSMQDNSLKGKWVKVEDDSISDTLKMLETNSQQISLRDAFDIKEEVLTINTYESLQATVTLLKELLKDDNLKITEKGATKTYTFILDFKDLATLLNKMGSTVDLKELDGSIKLVNTYKNKVAQGSTCEVKFTYQEGTESMSFNIKASEKIGKASGKVTLPKASQVVEMNENNM